MLILSIWPVLTNSAVAQSSGELFDVEVGLDASHPPFVYFDHLDGALTGFDVEIIRQICEEIGCEPKFLALPWQDLLYALEEDQVRIAAGGITSDDIGDREFVASLPYFETDYSLVAKEGFEPRDLPGIASLRLYIGSFRGQPYNIARELTEESRILQIGDFDRAVEDLQKGEIDLLVLDTHIARRIVELTPGQFEIAVSGLSSEQHSFFWTKGWPHGRRINGAIRKLQEDGRLESIIHQFWLFSPDIPLAE